MATIRQRTRQDGSSTYHVQVRLKGHPTQTETFKRKTDAKRWAQQTEAAIKEGRYFKTREAQKHTVAEMIDRYIASVGDDKKDAKNQAQQLRKWKDRIGEYVLADVSPALILEHRDRLGSETTKRGIVRGPATVNRMLAALPAGEEVTITNPMGRHNLAVGLQLAIDVKIEGHSGYYSGGMGKNVRIYRRRRLRPSINCKLCGVPA